MDSLYETLKNALQQTAGCRKQFEDAKEESQRLAAKYQDILTERQALREANRALNATIFQLRARVEDMETQLELQLDNMARPCACKTQSLSSAAHNHDGTLTALDSKPSVPIPISALDGKDIEKVVHVGQVGHAGSTRQPGDITQRESRAEIAVGQTDNAPREIGSNTSMSRFSSISSNGKSPTFDSRIWGTKNRSRFPETPSHSSSSYEIQERIHYAVKEPAKQQLYQPPHAQLKMVNHSGTPDSVGNWRNPGAGTLQPDGARKKGGTQVSMFL